MAGRTKEEDVRDGGPTSDETSAASPPRAAGRPAYFHPKGIESNIFLTAAAAVVPLVIVGVAGIKTILGAKRDKR